MPGLLFSSRHSEYGFFDEDGKINGDNWSLRMYLKAESWCRAAVLEPSWLRSPPWLKHYIEAKFDRNLRRSIV